VRRFVCPAPPRGNAAGARLRVEAAKVPAALQTHPQPDAQVRRTLQRTLHRTEKYFGGDGRGQITLLIRTIVESEGNQDALVEPIVSAVAMCMEPR
jgi:hypothetical protein